ncbi:MAG: hypothetical protein GY763_00300 [Gammaproteobacteria bacterium]|nr:hypothetical protein [Gammaproteobacteria bacterium]
MNYKIDDRLCELTDQITLDMGEMLLDIGLVKRRGLEVTVAAGGAGSDLRLSALTLKQNLKALNTMLDTYGVGY